MRLSHVFGAVSVLLALTTVASAADQTAAKTKAKHALRGVVVDIQRDQDKTTGTLVVKVQAQKKSKGTAGASATPANERKVHVTADTKFEKVTRVAKGEFKHESVAFKDLAKGDAVLIVPA